MAKSGVECSDVILDILNSYDVEFVFSSPGSEWPPIWEALARRKSLGLKSPRFVNCRHEELAVSAAIACTRITKKLAAVFLHTTVGTLHGAMAIRMAYHYNTPLVILAGESNSYGEGSFDPGGQWLRHLTDLGGPSNLIRGFVKWSETVDNPETLAGMLEHACEISLSQIPGPTFLTVPLEVMIQKTTHHLRRTSDVLIHDILPNPKLVEELANLLQKSRIPLIITENLGRDPEAVKELIALSEFLAIPVIEARSPSCLNFPRKHPLHLGFDPRPYLKKSDLVLLISVDGPWHPSSMWTGLKKVVLIDEDTTKQKVPIWDYKIDKRLLGTPRLTLRELSRILHSFSFPQDFIERRRRMFETEHYRRTKEWVSSARVMRKSKPIDSRWACYVLGKSLPENVIVVEELTSQRTIAEQLTFLSRPNSYFGGHIGGLGTGLGFALGAKLVSPERFVVALIGDGALSYNPVLACLGFSQEYDTPILIVVFNNESYDGMKDGLIKFYPKGYAVKKGTFYGSTIEPTPDYAGVIRAMGGYGTRVDNPIELEDVVQESVRKVQSGNTALVDIMLAPGARR